MLSRLLLLLAACAIASPAAGGLKRGGTGVDDGGAATRRRAQREMYAAMLSDDGVERALELCASGAVMAFPRVEVAVAGRDSVEFVEFAAAMVFSDARYGDLLLVREQGGSRAAARVLYMRW